MGAVEAGGTEAGGAGVVVLAAAASSRPPGLYRPPPPLLAPGFCGGTFVSNPNPNNPAVLDVLDVDCSECEERMLVGGTRDRSTADAEPSESPIAATSG